MLTFIPTPIGNLLDITFRALEVLKDTQVIFCEDTRVTKRLLSLLQERLDVKFGDFEFISFHEHNQHKRLKEIEQKLKEKNCIYMSDAGMPGISDPGAVLAKYCQDSGIDYDFLPGASVAPLIYAASGFSSGKFYFYGFLPNKGKERKEELKRLLNSGIDTIIYEAPHRIVKLIDEICVIDEDREIFAAKELTKRHQKYYKLTAKEFAKKLKEDSTKGEWALVVEGKSGNSSASLSLEEIKALELPPKQKAKLLAKLTNKSVKEWYSELIDNSL